MQLLPAPPGEKKLGHVGGRNVNDLEVNLQLPGFDVKGTSRGMGLETMQDRVDALTGSLEVRSAPGRGTVVTGRAPARSLEAAQA